MTYMATTPFGRRLVTAGLLEQIARADAPPQLPHAEKWALFDDLCAAKATYDVTDRDLAVLHALLGFHPTKELSADAQLVVFPSNASLSQRCHGMAESTLRRHLAALVRAGLIRRHDSPNGKRYARRRQGEVMQAYGFDLRPLLELGADIAAAADQAREQAEALRCLREEVVILRRDAVKLLAYAQDTQPDGAWSQVAERLDQTHRVLRRKMAFETLQALRDLLADLLKTLRKALLETPEMSGTDSRNERHHTESEIESSDFEQCEEGTTDAADAPNHTGPNVPLGMVLRACPDLLPYADRPPQSWRELVITAETVRPMMGISSDGWRHALRVMGPETASVCVAAILQKVSAIRSPGAYLRRLTQKAADGAFSPTPMILSLLRAAR